MARRAGSLLLALFVLAMVLPVALAEDSIGRIVELSGIVDVDTYGTGRFIRARMGDLLYDDSIVRTDFESWATIQVAGTTHVIPPRTENRAGAFLASRAAQSGSGVFRRLLSGIRDFLLDSGEEEAVTTGLRNEYRGASGGNDTWAVEADPEELYVAGLLAMEAGDFRAAVDSFSSIEFLEFTEIPIEDYYAHYVYSLIELESFQSALQVAFDSVRSHPAVESVDRLSASMQYAGGLAAYLLGEDDLALALLQAYNQRVGLSDAVPEAVGIVIRLLRSSGQEDRAERLLKDAGAAQPDVDWSALAAEWGG